MIRIEMIIQGADDSQNDKMKCKFEVEQFLPNGGERYLPKYLHTGRDLSAKDPIHSGVANEFNALLGRFKNTTYALEFNFKGCYIIVERDSVFRLNGTLTNKKDICSILARVAYASIFDDDKRSLTNKMLNWMKMPNDVAYVLENRVPYYFYEDYSKVEVRLNAMQIGERTVAIEISDGLWGEISFKDLNTYLGFYLHGKKRGHWKFLTPQVLFERLVGYEPKESDVEVMIAFLKQNRSEDIVEQRAKELLKDMESQYSNKVSMKTIDDKIHIRVKGMENDWLLIERDRKSDRQKVSVYVWGSKSHREDEDIIYYNGWKGPICVDNIASGSSLGDQFATRIFALMNDTLVVKRVNTISSYMTSGMERLELNDNFNVGDKICPVENVVE